MRSIWIEFSGKRVSREWLDANPEGAQELLGASADTYPLCLCSGTPLPLYVARRSQYYLARMPGTGPKHAVQCPHFEPDPEVSGRGLYAKSAIEERTDGRVQVKLDVPLLIRNGVGNVGPTSAPDASPRAQRTSVSLRGLLHLLWDRAGFNRWSPRMLGRRHYRQLRKYLLQAAADIIVRRAPLDEHLYMPEQFSSEGANDIEARRRDFFRKHMRSDSGAPQRILLCGQLRNLFEVEGEGWGMHLANLPNDFVVHVDPRWVSKLEKSGAFVFVDGFKFSRDSKCAVILLITLKRDRGGQWIADDIAELFTNQDYVPILSTDEMRVVARLVTEDRHFYKPLWYDGSSSRVPAFLLTDVGTSPVPMEIIDGREADQTERRMRVFGYIEDRLVHWVWDVAELSVPPPFLAPATKSVAAEREMT